MWGRSYIANVSSVDGKSAFLDEPAQSDHIAYFQSFARFHESGLPQQLPAERVAANQADTRVRTLREEVARLKSSQAGPREIRLAEGKLRQCRDHLVRKSKKEFHQQWVRERRDWKVLTRGLERPDDTQSADLHDILSKIWPGRGRLTTTMTSDRVASDRERRQAVEDLLLLATQQFEVLYRPGESPINGRCPVEACGREMER